MNTTFMDGRLAIVVLTFNRKQELRRTLQHLLDMPIRYPLCVVDNGSGDGSAAMVARHFPGVQLVRLQHNIGAAGRNHGVRNVASRYVAFCDDDTWWEPASLTEAVRLLDRQPRLAVVSARVLVGREEREDPVSTAMARSPLGSSPGLPGTLVAGMLAGACVVRRDAFLAAGGYEPRLFIGGEEGLLVLDLMAAGWELGYAPGLIVHHHPSRLRDGAARRRLLWRNALWCAWLRRPLGSAWRETRRLLRQWRHEPALLRALPSALFGLPWVLGQRRVVPAAVEARLRAVEEAEVPA